MAHEFDTDEAEPGGLSGRQRLGLIAGVVVAAALVIFIVQNTASTRVQWLMFDAELPLWATMLVSAAAGAFVAFVLMFLVRRRRGD